MHSFILFTATLATASAVSLRGSGQKLFSSDSENDHLNVASNFVRFGGKGKASGNALADIASSYGSPGDLKKFGAALNDLDKFGQAAEEKISQMGRGSGWGSGNPEWVDGLNGAINKLGAELENTLANGKQTEALLSGTKYKEAIDNIAEQVQNAPDQVMKSVALVVEELAAVADAALDGSKSLSEDVRKALSEYGISDGKMSLKELEDAAQELVSDANKAEYGVNGEKSGEMLSKMLDEAMNVLSENVEESLSKLKAQGVEGAAKVNNGLEAVGNMLQHYHGKGIETAVDEIAEGIGEIQASDNVNSLTRPIIHAVEELAATTDKKLDSIKPGAGNILQSVEEAFEQQKTLPAVEESPEELVEEAEDLVKALTSMEPGSGNNEQALENASPDSMAGDMPSEEAPNAKKKFNFYKASKEIKKKASNEIKKKASNASKAFAKKASKAFAKKASKGF